MKKKDATVVDKKSATKEEPQHVVEIFKNHLTKVVIQKGKYKGKERIDIRQWVCVDEKEKKWIPTKAGVSLSIDLLEELQAGIKSF